MAEIDINERECLHEKDSEYKNTKPISSGGCTIEEVDTEINKKLIDYPSNNQVVHNTGNENVDGVKTFNANAFILKNEPLLHFKLSTYIKGELPSNKLYQGVRFIDANSNTVGNFELQTSSTGYNVAYMGCRNFIINEDGSKTERNYNVGLRVSNDDRDIDFQPNADSVTNLGTSTNRWKTINGVEPSGLSLPSPLNASMIQIDTTSWVLDGEADIEYTPLGNGYLTLANNQNLEWIRGQIINDVYFGIYRFTYKYDSNIGGIQGITIPCIKGKKIIMKIKGTGFYNALFTFCQGNV